MLAILRLAFRALSAIAPGIAARVAESFWFRVAHPPISEDSQRFLASGERFETSVNGIRVVGWKWGAGPVVVALHGWGGYGAQMQPFVQPLVRAGHQVILFDAPSHGASGPSPMGPRKATLFDFSDALLEVSRDLTVAGVIAHSGGCAAAAWALRSTLRPQRMVFVAPFGNPSRYMEVFRAMLGFSDEVMHRFRANTERRFGFEWSEFEVTRTPQRARTPPLLVIHDRNDRETAWEDGRDIAAAWPNAKLETTTGLGHNRILRDAKAVDSVVRFLTAN